MPSATPLHNIICSRLDRLIQSCFDRSPVGGVIVGTDCRVSEDTVRKPDLGIFPGERWLQFDLRQVPIPCAPDIVIEIVSPSEHVPDLNRKERDYPGAGSLEVRLVDPENSELRIRARPGVRTLQRDEILESPLPPGFSVRSNLCWQVVT